MKLSPDTSGLPELMPYKQAASALGLGLRQVKSYVASGRLLTKGFGKAKKITKVSLLTLASEKSKPTPKTTITEQRIKRAKSREDREAAHIYRCAIEFMAGERAPALPAKPEATLAPAVPVSAVPANECKPGCRCVRHQLA
jgi:hypothetical protein